MSPTAPNVVHALAAPSEKAARRRLAELLPDLIPVRAGERIVLKPSLGSPLPASVGATTEIFLLDAVARYLLDHGAHPMVVESPSHSQRFNTVMELTGARHWAAALDIPLLDAQRLETATVRLPLPGRRPLKVRLPRAVLEADGLVALAKLKTHDLAGATMTAKNWMGLLSHDARVRFHSLGLDAPVRALAGELAPRTRASILDAIVAMEGEGPTRGDPVPLGVVLASQDPAAVDQVACAMAGLDLDKVRGLLPCPMEPEVRCHGLESLPHRALTPATPGSPRQHSLITSPPVRTLLRTFDLGRRRLSQPVLLEARCTRCLECVPVCLSRALDHPPRLVSALCTGCGLCLDPEVCPEQALIPESGTQKLLRLIRPENLGWD